MSKAISVTMIPQSINPATRQAITATKKRKVAGYARVSTDSDEQFTSYEAQVDYYTQYINSHPSWSFVKVYTDEGISGLNTKKRDGFNRMIQDAMDGKIDLIVTKSVSRFARNTVDSLTTIRMLKEKGTEVFFEKENIWTFDSKGELLITLMSSLAQEESRSISENVTWGQRKRFADGKVSLPYKHFLGYEKGPDGRPQIVPEQAKLVQRIYDLFLSGMTPSKIARQLTAESIPTPAGREKWTSSTVKSILTNEKYKGDALLQKKFTVDFLNKKMKTNEGEVPQYYVENSHEAIISPEIFEQVQAEFLRRDSLGQKYQNNSIFSSRIICGDCGGFYGRKVWNSTDKYRKCIWRCNSKYTNETKCSTPHLTEEEIEMTFIRAFDQMLPNREMILQDGRAMQSLLTDCSEIDSEIQQVSQERDVVSEMIEHCVSENASVALDQNEYMKRYNSLTLRYEEIETRLRKLREKRQARCDKASSIGGFLFRLSERDQILEHFDPRLWQDTIDNATVYHDGRIVFRFQTGVEITVHR